MRIPLQTPARKTAFLATSLLLGTLCIALAAAEFLAAHFSEKPDLTSLQRAVWLQPGNADYRYRVGRYFMLVVGSPQQAIESFRAAVSLDPHQARYWFDLAAAYQLLENSDAQQDALEHAIIADPKTPDVAWEAANLYLVRGQTDKALAEFRVVLDSDLSLSYPALQLCLRIDPELTTILQSILPANPQIYFNLLDLLMKKNDPAATIRVWNQLVQLHQPLNRGRVFDYMRYLILNREVDQARLVWQQAGTLSRLSAYQPSSENLVVNGDFSLDILNGGFDWLYQKSADVSVALDPTQTHSGHRSLSIIFDGQGISDAGVRQLIPVEPGQTYEFSANFKAESMEGAGGPQFTLQDLYSGTTYFASEDLKDADFWKPVSGTFTTGSDTRMLLLRVQRVPVGSPIRGKLWIDGVKLVETQPPQP
jgi:tetratricopeptide (TPR) repeat protein